MPWKPQNFLALLVASMGCWLERQAAAQIEYLKAENRLLRSRLGRRRIVFTDAERSTLAALAKEIGKKALRGLDPLVSPATLLRWHRELVARFWSAGNLADVARRLTLNISSCGLLLRIQAGATPEFSGHYATWN
jgi:hypothetical protein